MTLFKILQKFEELLLGFTCICGGHVPTKANSMSNSTKNRLVCLTFLKFRIETESNSTKNRHVCFTYSKARNRNQDKMARGRATPGSKVDNQKKRTL